MFTEYTVEAWRLFGGWVLFAIASLVGAVGWRMAYILNKSNGMANGELAKAEAEAREASAAHEEAAKKAERAQDLFNDNVELTGKLDKANRKAQSVEVAYRSVCAKLERLTPKRDKKGHFVKKVGEKKKVQKPVDRRKQRK